MAPGLYRHEKRLAGPLIASSVLMFFAGMAYCYFVVFGFVFKFIAGFAPASVSVSPDIEAYFGFVMSLFIAFGLTFEVPIVVVLLVRFGIASIDKLKKARPYVIVGAFIVAAIFTPPDVLSQLLLAIPLCVLVRAGNPDRPLCRRPEGRRRNSAATGSVVDVIARVAWRCCCRLRCVACSSAAAGASSKSFPMKTSTSLQVGVRIARTIRRARWRTTARRRNATIASRNSIWRSCFSEARVASPTRWRASAGCASRPSVAFRARNLR